MVPRHTSRYQPQGLHNFFRGPYDPQCVWNLADNAITPRGESGLPTVMDIANGLRCMNGADQNRFVFQMSRILSIVRVPAVEVQTSQGVHGPRQKQTVGEHRQSQQPYSEPSELTPQCHLGPEQAPTEGPETSRRTKQVQ